MSICFHGDFSIISHFQNASLPNCRVKSLDNLRTGILNIEGEQYQNYQQLEQHKRLITYYLAYIKRV
jgi:hypothetical protein